MIKEYPFSIGEIVKSNNAQFAFYRANHLYYDIIHRQADGDNEPRDLGIYQFPIPLEDLGNATVKAEEKAITLMRYIRKAMADGTLVEVHYNN